MHTRVRAVNARASDKIFVRTFTTRTCVCVYGSLREKKIGGQVISCEIKFQRQKKYSIVGPKGDIEWRLRDVTSLECPGRKKAVGRPMLALQLSQGTPNKKQKFNSSSLNSFRSP